MKVVKHTAGFYAWVISIGIALYLLDSANILTFKLFSIHPLLLIPLLVSVAMNAREWAGLTIGTFFGILLDITATGSYCFNLITFSIIGCVCGLLSSYRVNNNIYSAALLSLLSSVGYFSAHWFVFCFLLGHGDTAEYFWRYSLPQSIYSALFIFAFYFLIKYISKRTHYII